MLTQNQQQQKNLGDFILQKVQRKNKLSYQISANLKRRCWSKIECSSSNTLLLLIKNQLMSVCFHFSPVPFQVPTSQMVFMSVIYCLLFFQSLQELLSLTSLVVWTFVVVAIVLLKLYCWDIHKGEIGKVLTASTSYSQCSHKTVIVGQDTE